MRFSITALLCVLLCFGAAYAQSDRGTITGTVTDPTGAMIPNASIEAKNVQTGVVYKAASSETGNYTLAQLPVGTYQLSATVTGFKQFVRTGITVSTAQTLRVDVKLEVGNISETVTVSADAPLLKTESGELSQVVTSSRMNDLPMLNISQFGIRDTYAAINLLPGAGEINPGFILRHRACKRHPGRHRGCPYRRPGCDRDCMECGIQYGHARRGLHRRDCDPDQQLFRRIRAGGRRGLQHDHEIRNQPSSWKRV